jgi:hypothetical protein
MKLSNRVAGVCGIVFVVLSAAIAVTAPPLPTLTAGAAEVGAYYSAHQGGFLAGNYLGAVALVPGLVLLAFLVQGIRSAEAPGGAVWLLAALASGVGFASALFLLALLQATGVVAPTAEPGTAKALSDVSNIAFGMSLLPLGAMVGSLSWGFLATGVLSRWIGCAGLVVALVNLLASLGTVILTGPMAAGGPATLVAFIALVGWSLWVSIAVLVSRDMAAAPERERLS